MEYINTNGTIDLFEEDIMQLDLKDCIFTYDNHEFMLKNASEGEGLLEQIKTIRAFLNGEQIQIISENSLPLLKEKKAQVGGCGDTGVLFYVLIDKHSCHYPITKQTTDLNGILTEIKTDSTIVYNNNHFIIVLKDLLK